MSPNLDAAKIIWPSVAAIFPRNPIILLIDVYSLLRRVVVDGLAADDNADDDNEDGGGGGVGCNLNEIQANKKKQSVNIEQSHYNDLNHLHSASLLHA